MLAYAPFGKIIPKGLLNAVNSMGGRNSSPLEVSIEFLCLSITAVQFLFAVLTCLLYKKCNRRKLGW